MDLSKFGTMPENAKAEDTFQYIWDTIILKNTSESVGASINRQTIFDPRNSRAKVLNNETLPLTQGRIIRLEALRITHNIKFTYPQQFHVLEEFSRINVNIEDKDYTPMPLHHFLPYNRIAFGSYGTTSYITGVPPTQTINYDNPLMEQIASGKDAGFTKLYRPIEVPESGKITLEFIPGAEDLVTSVITKSNGVTFGSNIVDSANSPVQYIKFEFVGRLVRKVTR